MGSIINAFRWGGGGLDRKGGGGDGGLSVELKKCCIACHRPLSKVVQCPMENFGSKSLSHSHGNGLTLTPYSVCLSSTPAHGLNDQCNGRYTAQ